MIRPFSCFLFAVALVVPTTAWAQAPAISRTITVTFTGIVANDIGNAIYIRQSNGTLTPYTGPVPTLPYAQGQPISISYQAVVPTAAYYTSPAYTGAVAADGVYRFTVTNPQYSGGGAPDGIGDATVPSITAGILTNANPTAPTNVTQTIVYNANTDSYFLEGSGGFVSGRYSGPGFTYDRETYDLQPCAAGSACGNPRNGNKFDLTGNAAGDGISAGKIGIFNPMFTQITAFFDLVFSGSWSLPQFSSSGSGGSGSGSGSGGGGTGGAIQVPEPGAMGLFGGAFAILPFRRRLGNFMRKKPVKTDMI